MSLTGPLPWFIGPNHADVPPPDWGVWDPRITVESGLVLRFCLLDQEWERTITGAEWINSQCLRLYFETDAESVDSEG